MGFKILLVDDEDAIRNHFKKVLIDEGYEVVEANEGEKGIELFKAENPDLVLLDVNMPGKSGLEVLKEIKSINESITVFLLTAQESHKRNFASLYAEEFIPKDKNLDILRSRIKMHLIDRKDNN